MLGPAQMRKPATCVERSTLNIQRPSFALRAMEGTANLIMNHRVGAFTYFGTGKNNFVKSGATGFDVGIILVQRPAR